jgi:putative oxidoreductase
LRLRIGRFTKLGLPFPHFTATFIRGLEIVGGLLLLSGLMTRLIAIPFVCEMIVAILSTKISLYSGTSSLPLPPGGFRRGVWAVLHEVRSEYAQMLTVMFLLINGPGKWSLDAVLLRNGKKGGVSKLVQPHRPLGLAVAANH